MSKAEILNPANEWKIAIHESKPQISFSYGSGFSGNTFYMEINEEIIKLNPHHFNTSEKQAEARAKDLMKQRGIEYNKPIIFVWNGTL